MGIKEELLKALFEADTVPKQKQAAAERILYSFVLKGERTFLRIFN